MFINVDGNNVHKTEYASWFNNIRFDRIRWSKVSKTVVLQPNI
jgi:hypothetical protein